LGKEKAKREQRTRLRACLVKEKAKTGTENPPQSPFPQNGIEYDFDNFPSARGSAKTELKSFNQKELPIIWQLFFLFI
jgi:hypothetical protein